MASRRRLCLVASIVMTVGLVFTGCGTQPEEPPRPPTPVVIPTETLRDTFISTLELSALKTTLEDASTIIGTTIPVPDYLPIDYEIQEVYIEDSTVILLISDEKIEKELATHTDAAGTRQRHEFQLKMRMNIRWYNDQFPIPFGKAPYEKVMINENRGFVMGQDDRNIIWWRCSPKPLPQLFDFYLSANIGLPKEELARVAESVPTPEYVPHPNPTRPIKAEIITGQSIVVPQGETGMITIRVTSQSSELVKASVFLKGEQPAGVQAEFQPDTFSLNSNESVDVEVTVMVDPTAPPPKWSRQPPPPKGFALLDSAITETAYYSLTICFGWIFPVYIDEGEESRRPICKSIKLRFEEPPPPPPGMVTLKEASEAVDFPISIQLPRYMPEGTEPPFIGLVVTPEEPHGVVIHYATFQVIMVPEPGVAGPSADVVGEWTTIRRKQVFIGENRVDWWVYDIHYSIVSDQVPIEEQIIVAESMMLVGPGSGSWLEQE